MSAWAYYNEHDAYAAEWLKNLIAAGHIAPGEVDTRSIEDVTPDELRGFTQCHFFAGIGVWSHALRRAGFSDDRQIWTGSCPCQPFSAAGQRKGTADERHLWPAFFHLIEALRPPLVAGEQVASKDGLAWVDIVQADLEGAGYAFRPVDLCAAGFGGAHIRQRLYFVGVADCFDAGLEGRTREPERAEERAARARGVAGGLVDPGGSRLPQQRRDGGISRATMGAPQGESTQRAGSSTGGLADADGGHACAEREQRGGQQRQQPQDGGVGGVANADGRVRCSGKHEEPCVHRGSEPLEPAGMPAGEPRPHAPLLGRHAADWLFCRDGKWRPVEPGTFPLAHAAPARVGRLRAFGNALDAETATEFLAAVHWAVGADLA